MNAQSIMKLISFIIEFNNINSQYFMCNSLFEKKTFQHLF